MVLVIGFITCYANNEYIMLVVVIAKQSVLIPGLVLKAYNVNIITQGARLRSAPASGGLHAKEPHVSVTAGSARD
jgi:hypothetical protein